MIFQINIFNDFFYLKSKKFSVILILKWFYVIIV